MTNLHSEIQFAHGARKELSTNSVQPNNKSKKLALVVEGGGMRGIFSSGVLDSFHENGFDPFDTYLGVSSGSLNLMSHLAGQYRRNYRVVMACATSGQFINGWKYLRGGNYIDLDWLDNECLDLHPLDKDSAFRHINQTNREFHVVCTNVYTGQAIYYQPTEKTLTNVLRGSCSVPLMYRHPVFVDGMQVIDGGVSDPIPVRKAYEMGATDIVVIRTRDKNYRKKDGLEVKLGAYAYRNYSHLQRTILKQTKTYNESLAFIANPPEDVNVYQIAASLPLHTNRTTTNTTSLNRDYQLGKYLGEEFIHFFRDTLESRKATYQSDAQSQLTA